MEAQVVRQREENVELRGECERLSLEAIECIASGIEMIVYSL